MTGTDLVHVPYRGSGPAGQDLIAGTVQAMFDSVPASAGAVRDGRLRALGVTTKTRIAPFPDLPTIAEAGVPGYEYRGWVGVFAPTGTPKPIIDKLNTEIKKAIDSPELKKRLEEFEPWTMSPQAMAARIQSDYEKYGRLMKLVGSKLD
jgi:tripartite-type tricarboxylate transporter receptor subunit TctC